MRNLFLIPLLVVGCGLTLVACGGGNDAPTKADFRKEYAPISAEIRAIGNDVGTAVTAAKGKSDIELQAQFGDLADRANAAATSLAAADVPDDATIKAARSELVAGVKKAAADLDAISAAATAGDAEAAKAATIKLATDSAGVREPRRKLDELVLSSSN